ncbi:MAG: hypothetical protein MUP27_16245 [Desulfobacterales bacterium]|nr:hypothetical protein [Desulfobacterales bacterium]
MLTTDSLGTYLQKYEIAEKTYDGTTALTEDFDLRDKAFSGFMSLVIIPTVTTEVEALNTFKVTVMPLVRNAANTAWFMPVNSAALVLEDTLTLEDLDGASWSVNKLFELSGDANKFMMAEGLRFTFVTVTTGATYAGKFVGRILLR